jgi:hypothetical protein
MLAGFGVFVEESQGTFRLNPAAATLQTGVTESLHNAVKMVGDVTGDGSWWNAVGHFTHSVLKGEPAFNYVHATRFFEYLTRHPDASRWFDRGLANFATPENAAIVRAYDFTSLEKIVDVGGGQGGLPRGNNEGLPHRPRKVVRPA